MNTSNYKLVELRGHPIIGSLKEFREDRLRFLTETAQIAPLVKFRLGPRRVYLVSHPNPIRDMLVTQHRHMTRDPLARRILKKTLGEGLLTSDGDHWKRQRRMIAPALHLRRVATYADIMVAHAMALAERWNDAQIADIEKEMGRLTLSIVTAALFNIDSTRYLDTIAEIVAELQTIATRQFNRLVQIPDWLPTPENRRQRALSHKIGRIILEEIRTRRAHGADGSDLLTMLVHMEDAETGEHMTDEEIRDEVMTLYLAGYETTALTITYCWYYLARQPEMEALFHDELDRVLAGRPPILEDLERLPYTRAIFKEALRLHPPAYFMVRAVAEQTEIGGHPIPAGTVLMTSPFAMHRHPGLWDEPERFQPERFANEADHGWHKFKYFPFGGGPRICIGNQFALVEGPLILATLGQLYRFELQHPGQRLELEPQITVGPKGGLPLRFRQRTRGH
jgi:cytochrome P450